MDQKTSATFFDSVRWFNDFFSDVKTLFDKIASVFENNTEYSESNLYYYKKDKIPSIPSTYFLYMQGEATPKLQLVAIFDKEFVKNPHLDVNEPSLMVVQHNYERYDNGWIGWNILEGKNISESTRDGDLLSGVFEKKVWGEGINFTSFIIPLEVFSEYDDKIVIEKIIERLP